MRVARDARAQVRKPELMLFLPAPPSFAIEQIIHHSPLFKGRRFLLRPELACRRDYCMYRSARAKSATPLRPFLSLACGTSEALSDRRFGVLRFASGVTYEQVLIQSVVPGPPREGLACQSAAR
jgi:hypothetical protein